MKVVRLQRILLCAAGILVIGISAALSAFAGTEEIFVSGSVPSSESISLVATRGIVIKADISAKTIEVDTGTDATSNGARAVFTAEADGSIHINISDNISVRTILARDGESRISTMVASWDVPGVLDERSENVDTVTRELWTRTYVSKEMCDAIPQGKAYVRDDSRADKIPLFPAIPVTIKENPKRIESQTGDKANTASNSNLSSLAHKLLLLKMAIVAQHKGIDSDTAYVTRLQRNIDVSPIWGLGSTLSVRGPDTHFDYATDHSIPRSTAERSAYLVCQKSLLPFVNNDVFGLVSKPACIYIGMNGTQVPQL